MRICFYVILFEALTNRFIDINSNIRVQRILASKYIQPSLQRLLSNVSHNQTQFRVYNRACAHEYSKKMKIAVRALVTNHRKQRLEKLRKNWINMRRKKLGLGEAFTYWLLASLRHRALLLNFFEYLNWTPSIATQTIDITNNGIILPSDFIVQYEEIKTSAKAALREANAELWSELSLQQTNIFSHQLYSKYTNITSQRLSETNNQLPKIANRWLCKKLVSEYQRFPSHLADFYSPLVLPSQNAGDRTTGSSLLSTLRRYEPVSSSSSLKRSVLLMIQGVKRPFPFSGARDAEQESTRIILTDTFRMDIDTLYLQVIIIFHKILML
jgi:hypothetical protein